MTLEQLTKHITENANTIENISNVLQEAQNIHVYTVTDMWIALHKDTNEIYVCDNLQTVNITKHNEIPQIITDLLQDK